MAETDAAAAAPLAFWPPGTPLALERTFVSGQAPEDLGPPRGRGSKRVPESKGDSPSVSQVEMPFPPAQKRPASVPLRAPQPLLLAWHQLRFPSSFLPQRAESQGLPGSEPRASLGVSGPCLLEPGAWGARVWGSAGKKSKAAAWEQRGDPSGGGGNPEAPLTLV